MDYRFDTATVSNTIPEENPEAVGWFDAMRQQFHQARSSRRTQETMLAGAIGSGASLHGVWMREPTRLHPHPELKPVATFCTFPGSVNVSGTSRLPAQLITDVTVHPAHRRRGLLRKLMTAQVHRAMDEGLPLAALTATEGTIYERFGFGTASMVRGVSIDTTRPPVMRPHAEHWGDQGRVDSVAPSEVRSVMDAVFPRFHETTRGSVDRPSTYQDVMAGDWNMSAQTEDLRLRAIAHTDAHGVLDGYALYVPIDEGDGHFGATLQIRDLISTNPVAHLALWEFLVSVDLAPRVKWDQAPAEGPLRWAMTNQRALETTAEEDMLWLRILDPVRVLEARPWSGTGRVRLGLHDPMDLSSGTYGIEVEEGHARVRKVSDTPADGEVRLEAPTLANAILGAAQISMLSRAGRIAGDGPAIARLDGLMATRTAPWCATFF